MLEIFRSTSYCSFRQPQFINKLPGRIYTFLRMRFDFEQHIIGTIIRQKKISVIKNNVPTTAVSTITADRIHFRSFLDKAVIIPAKSLSSCITVFKGFISYLNIAGGIIHDCRYYALIISLSITDRISIGTVFGSLFNIKITFQHFRKLICLNILDFLPASCLSKQQQW